MVADCLCIRNFLVINVIVLFREFQILRIFLVLFPDSIYILSCKPHCSSGLWYLHFPPLPFVCYMIGCIFLLGNYLVKYLTPQYPIQLILDKFTKIRLTPHLFTNHFCILLTFLVLPAFILYLLWWRFYAPWFIWCRVPLYIQEVQYKSINNNNK